MKTPRNPSKDEEESLRREFSYSPDTGAITRKSDGIDVGRLHYGKGNNLVYMVFNHSGRLYLCHRVAFFLMTGGFPKEFVDHADHDGTNNKWGNLRQATHSDNQRNRRININNKSGIPGVRYEKDYRRWDAKIGTGTGTPKRLLRTKDFFEACCARKAAENRLGYK